jgi:hypothetical protein
MQHTACVQTLADTNLGNVLAAVTTVSASPLASTSSVSTGWRKVKTEDCPARWRTMLFRDAAGPLLAGDGSRQAAAASSAFFDWVNCSPGSGNDFTRFRKRFHPVRPATG